jgi:hypothetical protein
MSSVQEIRAEPEIADWIRTHQGAAKQAKHAIEILADKPDGVAAVKKLFPALADKKLFVFFSYKKKDERTAKAVVKVLRRYAAGKLRIAYQADFTEEIAGKQWREKIRDEVCRANWFILLLPDPSDDWDWCLYETGLFDRQPTSADRLICLHHPDTEIPSPIQDYHAVPANITDVEKFLRMVYVNKDPVPGMEPINKDVEPELRTIAKEIVDAIRPPRKGLVRRIFEPWMELKVDNAAGLQNKDDLDDALIVSANDAVLNLFERFEQPETWGELRSGVTESAGDGRWRDELFHVIRKIADGRIFSPIQAVFHTKDGRIYRPVACAIDRVGEKGAIETYHITFTEDVGAVDTTAMPQGVSTLAHMLRLAFRFRWEVLERFSKGALTEDDVERVDNVLRRIEQDAESRGILDQDADMSLFPSKQATRIAEMFAIWYTLRNPEETGELDVAIKKKDTQQISAILAKMIPLNQEFLEMAATRFSELVYEKS